MTNTYIPLYSNGRLSRDDFELIEARLIQSEAVLRKKSAFAGLQDVDVLVCAENCRPDLPIWGTTRDPSRIEITVDPRQAEAYRNPKRSDLARASNHEHHHAKRMDGVGYGRTLGCALVSEGLAQCFEVETVHEVGPYSICLSEGELSSAPKAMQRHRNRLYIGAGIA